MDKLFIGMGLVVLTATALLAFLSIDKQSTTVSNRQAPNKIVSVSLVEDGATELSAAGQIAYLDPVTGQLRSKLGDPLANRSALPAQVDLPPIKITTYADGTVQATLNGRFQTRLMGTIGCDGKLITAHSDKLELKGAECGANQ